MIIDFCPSLILHFMFLQPDDRLCALVWPMTSRCWPAFVCQFPADGLRAARFVKVKTALLAALMSSHKYRSVQGEEAFQKCRTVSQIYLESTIVAIWILSIKSCVSRRTATICRTHWVACMLPHQEVAYGLHTLVATLVTLSSLACVKQDLRELSIWI